MMDLQISMADGADIDEIASLYRWLSQDPDVIREAALSLGASADHPDAMAPVLDVINVVVSNSIAAVSMVLAAIALWRQNRAPAPEVRVATVTVTVTVQDADPDTLVQVAAKITNVGQHGSADAAGSS
jgi:hypothetical protein